MRFGCTLDTVKMGSGCNLDAVWMKSAHSLTYITPRASCDAKYILFTVYVLSPPLYHFSNTVRVQRDQSPFKFKLFILEFFYSYSIIHASFK